MLRTDIFSDRIREDWRSSPSKQIGLTEYGSVSKPCTPVVHIKIAAISHYPSSMVYGRPYGTHASCSCLVASRPNLQAIQTRGWHQALGQATILEVRFHR